jgi:hypothetical protein
MFPLHGENRLYLSIAFVFMLCKVRSRGTSIDTLHRVSVPYVQTNAMQSESVCQKPWQRTRLAAFLQELFSSP